MKTVSRPDLAPIGRRLRELLDKSQVPFQPSARFRAGAVFTATDLDQDVTGTLPEFVRHPAREGPTRQRKSRARQTAAKASGSTPSGAKGSGAGNGHRGSSY
jgi:hypothetical protein